MLFILGAVVFGLFTKYVKPNQKVEFVAGLVLLLVMLAVGIAFPLYFTKNTWIAVVMVYLFLDLHRNGLPVLSICYANVANDAAS